MCLPILEKYLATKENKYCTFDVDEPWKCKWERKVATEAHVLSDSIDVECSEQFSSDELYGISIVYQ